RSLMSTRLSQWDEALQLIAQRPWLGWGAAAFSVLYPLRTGRWHGHAHNLPLELAVSHGLPVALLVVGTVLALLITALRRGVLNGGVQKLGMIRSTVFDRAWWAASLILVVMHATDLPFFDSRLNIFGWILLAGLRCVIFPLQVLPSSESMLDLDARSVSPG
ncbi:MAG TPA: O-antigen ligase family protein, partial [Prochlorococcus sp.]